jgi:hypothetical protein
MLPLFTIILPPHEGSLIVSFFIFIIYAGQLVYVMKTGKFPRGKFGGVLRRSEKPAAFYFGIFLFSSIALVAALCAIDSLLLMNHHHSLLE